MLTQSSPAAKLALYAAALLAAGLGEARAQDAAQAAQAAPAAPPGGPPACQIGRHDGLPDSDAQTAAGMICEEVRNLGRPVGLPTAEAQVAGPRYLVQLDKLGASVVVRLTQVDAAGAVVIGRTLSLGKIEDLPVAAPRLARAVVRNESLEETQQMDNLVGSESRTHQKLDGETLLSAGVLTGVLTGVETTSALVGADLAAGYEFGDFGLNASMRLGAASTAGDSGKDGAFFGMSVGGRYFFNRGNGAAFLGTGLGFDVMEIGNFEGTLPAAYLEAGYELFRLTESRLTANLRVDLPLGSVRDSGDGYFAEGPCDGYGSCGHWVDTAPQSGYVVPLTLAVSYAF